MAKDARYLTTREVGRRAGVSAKTVGRWVDAGFLPAVFTAGGHRRVLEGDLDVFLESRRPLGSGRAGPGLSVLLVSEQRATAAAVRHAARVVGAEVLVLADPMEAALRVVAEGAHVLIGELISPGKSEIARLFRHVAAHEVTGHIYRIGLLSYSPDSLESPPLHRRLRVPVHVADIVGALHDALEHRERVNAR